MFSVSCLSPERSLFSGNSVWLWWELGARSRWDSVTAQPIGILFAFFERQPYMDPSLLGVAEGVSSLLSAVSAPLRVTPEEQEAAPCAK